MEKYERIISYPPHKGSIECIESWHSEDYTQWYRIYSDGWCEQGGVHITTNRDFNTVTLFKSYIDTNYSVIFNHEIDITNHASYVGYPTSYQKTRNSWNYTPPVNISNNPRIRWETKGYIS